ncbi:MAG TPA: VanW family protein [Candidatus Limnocylindrales bacterium]
MSFETAPSTPGRRGSSLGLRFAIAFLLGVVLVVGAGGGALFAYGQQYSGRVLPGVRVGTTDLSGLTPEAAGRALSDAYAPLGSGQLLLAGPDGELTVGYGELGRAPDVKMMLGEALAAGRQGEPVADLIGAPQTAIRGVILGAAVTYDPARLTAAVDAVAKTIDRAPVNATLALGKDGTYTTTPSVDGRVVDRAALAAAIDAAISPLDAPSEIRLDIPFTTGAPAITTADAEAATAAADRMAKDVVLTRGGDTWTIHGASIRKLISFAATADGGIAPVVDEAGIAPLLKPIVKAVNQTVKNAGYKLSGSHVVATGTSREGRTLDAAATQAVVLNVLTARQAGTPDGTIEPVVAVVAPAVTTEQAKAFAAKMRPISSFSVYYWVIVNNHWGGNIEAPATKINGTVVPAGGTFDFWKVVGDLRKLPGEGPGNAIEGGKITVTGAFGGGICTTSTTLFNAAIHAGMVPLARQNHNEFITRYPPGLDATVWIVGTAKQTMSFKNDTAYPILIQRTITHAGSKRWLTFKIWSVPNGRTTKITNTVIQNGPRAIDTVVKDPTKPVGYSYRNNAPADGAKVWVTVSIYDHGKLHWTKRYYSNYPAVKGVLVVGTKT